MLPSPHRALRHSIQTLFSLLIPHRSIDTSPELPPTEPPIELPNTGTTVTIASIHTVMRSSKGLTVCQHIYDTVMMHESSFSTRTTTGPTRPTKHARVVMIAAVCKTCPEVLFEANDARSRVVCQHANQWWDTLEGALQRAPPLVPGALSRARSSLESFRQSFEEWQSRDAQELVSIVVESWVNLEETRTHQHCPPALLAHIQATQRTMEARATSLGVSRSGFRARVERFRMGQEDASYVLSSPSSPSSTSSSTPQPPSECTLLATIQRAFWDAFQDRLRQHDTTQLRAMLHELLHAVHALTPHRTDLHDRLERAVDIELLVQMVTHQSMDTTHFGRATRAVVDHLKPLLAQARVEAFDTWFTEWQTKCATDLSQPFEQHLPAFFERLHKEIGIAQRGCDRVRQAMRTIPTPTLTSPPSAPPDTTYPKSQSQTPP